MRYGTGSYVESSPENISPLLRDLRNGDQDAASKLTPLLYKELRRLARNYMRRERTDHTLQATALVHEAYLRLVKQPPTSWQDRSHFFGIAAHVMRQILIDHARGHVREKRGGAQKAVPLDEAFIFSPGQSAEVLRLDEALERLAKLDPRQSKIVELRFFGGVSVEEAAEFLKISPKTVKRDWSMARAWLRAELSKRT
jgi:RNA polymerase sigma-70 factor, ECF subfamily